MKSVLNGKIRVTLRTGQTDQSLSFDKPTLTLGRAPDSDVFISDSKVSKKHLSIVFENGAIYGGIYFAFYSMMLAYLGFLSPIALKYFSKENLNSSVLFV